MLGVFDDIRQLWVSSCSANICEDATVTEEVNICEKKKKKLACSRKNEPQVTWCRSCASVNVWTMVMRPRKRENFGGEDVALQQKQRPDEEKISQTGVHQSVRQPKG